MVVLLTDDSLIAPEYRVDRIGWHGRSSSKQSSRQVQQRDQDNKKAVEKHYNQAKYQVLLNPEFVKMICEYMDGKINDVKNNVENNKSKNKCCVM